VFLFHRCQTDKNQDDERRHTRHKRNFTVNGEVIFFRNGIIPKRLQKSSRSIHPSNLVTEVGGPQGKNKINIRGINSGNFDIIYFKTYLLLLSEDSTSVTQEIICEKNFLPYGIFFFIEFVFQKLLNNLEPMIFFYYLRKLRFTLKYIL
jgi:hypothetical protein